MDREQIIKALECCGKFPCEQCPYYTDAYCPTNLRRDALSLIKELTEENERLRGERAKLFEYKHGTLVRNALVLTKNKKELDEFCETIKADTVRKMQERLKAKAYTSSDWSHGEHPKVAEIDDIDQIAIEMLEGEK